MHVVPLSVLVVDDHVAFRAAARTILETHGFTVVAEAGDLAGAVRAARSTHPEVALVDIGLPDADGFAVTAELMRIDAALQVVLVSSRDRLEVASRVRDSQARGFLPKEELTPAALSMILAGRL
jgi:DNA-binding NarL/FixJ family response regulator